MKHASLSREICDARNIKVVCGFGEVGNSGSDDTDSMTSPERVYNTEIQKEDEDSEEVIPEVINMEEAKHQAVWSPEYEGKPRVISHGDLKFDLGNRVVAVLPLYLLKGKLTQMAVVAGKIVDIYSICVDGKDVPREVKPRISPDASKFKSDAKGAVTSNGDSIYDTPSRTDDLMVKDWKESRNRTQTMVISYKILLDEEFRLSQSETKAIYEAASTVLKLPYRYSTYLKFETDAVVPKKKKRSKSKAKQILEYVTISYRYIMGLELACKKLLASTKRSDPIAITIEDIQEQISRSRLSSGIFVQYSDLDVDKRNSGMLSFVILDHVCYAPYDIRFVIRCSGPVRRILAISKVSGFDVRCAYPVDEYHFFHPIDRYVYTIINPNDSDFNQTNSIKDAIKSIFDPIEVYIVKKSLCTVSDIEYNVFEDSSGRVKFVPAEKTSNTQPTDTRYAGSTHAKGPYRYSGISIASYIRGLAYPEGNCPTQHDLYTFFNSKDYYEIDLDPDSSTFLEFVCTSGSHSLFRNPMSKDVILAVSFVCDRDQHKGKTNLRWFYPSDELRLLHLYIKTDGNHAQFKLHPGMKKGAPTDPKSYLRSMFSGATLCIIDLLIFGPTKANPTLKSKFTRRFMSRYFWWEKLNSELQQDPNFDYQDD